jgi:CDP-diacylglycerol--glycerol-3-phosphate 3-phosphatidyltransferase
MTFTGLIGTICMFPLRAIIRACVVLRIHPNVLTFVGVLINVVAAWALATGRFGTAGGIMIAANIFDFIDGKVAREMGMESAFGGFWDSVMDRFSDLALFLGLVYLYSSLNRTDYVVITVMAMIFTVLTSYARARAESVVAKCKVGFMERPERIVLFMIGAFTNRMAGVLWVILVLSILTVADRIFYTWRELERARRLSGCRYERAERRRPPAPRRDRRRRHQPAAAAARDLAHALLDLRARHLAVRPDGHRHPRLRVAGTAGVDRRPARLGPRGDRLAGGLAPRLSGTTTRPAGLRRWGRAHSRSSARSS